MAVIKFFFYHRLVFQTNRESNHGDGVGLSMGYRLQQLGVYRRQHHYKNSVAGCRFNILEGHFFVNVILSICDPADMDITAAMLVYIMFL